MVISPDSTEAFLSPLPVSRLYGVGPKTASVLEGMGIRTIVELAAAAPAEMERRFGRKFAAYLLSAASGTDPNPVTPGLEPTQFSRIVTLKRDTKDPHEAYDRLSEGIEYVQGKLESSGKAPKTITAIGILTDLSTKTKSKSFDSPIADLTTIRETTLSLFEELSESVEKDFRRVGVRVSGFEKAEDQTSLSEFVSPGR